MKNGFDQNDLRKKLSIPHQKNFPHDELHGKSHTRLYDIIWANHNVRFKYDRGFQSKIGFCQNDVHQKLSYPKHKKNPNDELPGKSHTTLYGIFQEVHRGEIFFGAVYSVFCGDHSGQNRFSIGRRNRL